MGCRLPELLVNVQVQHTLVAPKDYVDVDSKNWARLKCGPDPNARGPGGKFAARPTATRLRGHIHRICIQGVELHGDHYAVEHIDDDTVKATVWFDDPRTNPVGERYGSVWTFRTLRPDPRFGGALNTDQERVVYADLGGGVGGRWKAIGPMDKTVLRPFSEFVRPPEKLIRHGLLVPDKLNLRHEEIRRPRGWRTCVERVPVSELCPNTGHIPTQRSLGRYIVPDGTRTYYARDTARAVTNITADNELAYETATATPGNVQSGNIGSAADIIFCSWTTPSGEPDSAAWPTGDYRHQIDCIAIGANITYGFLTIGASAGIFARVNDALSSTLESKTQAEGAFSGTGLKLATTGSVSWTAGNASDRWQGVLAAGRSANHGNQTITLQLNETDDFSDGPWAAPSTPDDNAAFFGMNF